MLPSVRSGALGIASVGLLVVLAGQEMAPTPGLQRSFPEGLPDTTGWETSRGAAEFASPNHSVEYELYVSPERQGVYTVARYRIRFDDADERKRQGIAATEKLQWDVDGRTVHRYECVGAFSAQEPCAWRQLAFGTPEFEQETANLLRVYALHRRLLHERDNPSLD